ncbi:hypothetical protein GQ472_06000 [archaeon]|nr:hypothetical protein [archaeon]
MYIPLSRTTDLKDNVSDFIDRFISDMESSADISLAGWLYPNLNETFYDVLTKTGYAGWSYLFDYPDIRKIYCVQAELKDEDREPTFYDAQMIASLPDKLPGYFIEGENPAGFFNLTKYFIDLTVLDRFIMNEPFRENIDAIIFEHSYKEKDFTQWNLIYFYGMHLGYNIFDNEKFRILKYFIDHELTLLRSEKIISKTQKEKAKEPNSFRLIAPKKLFSRINDNISALSSKATSSPETLFPEDLTPSL